MQSQGKSMGAGLLRNAIGFDKTPLGCIKHIQWMALMALSWLHEGKKSPLTFAAQHYVSGRGRGREITLLVPYTYMSSLFLFYSLHLLLIKKYWKTLLCKRKSPVCNQVVVGIKPSEDV